MCRIKKAASQKKQKPFHGWKLLKYFAALLFNTTTMLNKSATFSNPHIVFENKCIKMQGVRGLVAGDAQLAGNGIAHGFALITVTVYQHAF